VQRGRTRAHPGEREEALEIIEGALAGVGAGSPFFYEAELHRLRGTLLLDKGERYGAAAEASFRTALDMALDQHARSLELRAAVSLGRQLLARGAVAAAHDLVAPVYAWFTEGHDTLDLREARVLLDQLAAAQ